MSFFQVGHWIIREDGIAYKESLEVDREQGLNEQNAYFIDRERLTEITNYYGSPTYDWLVHIAAKKREVASENDIYALNSAFIYATRYYKQNFDIDIFIETLKRQRLLFDENDDDGPSFLFD